MQEVEAQQLALLRRDLDACRTELKAYGEHYACLRDCFISIHHTLSPQPLATAFGYSDAHLAPFQVRPAAAMSLTAALMKTQPPGPPLTPVEALHTFNYVKLELKSMSVPANPVLLGRRRGGPRRATARVRTASCRSGWWGARTRRCWRRWCACCCSR